ncbi:cytochrome P450 [Aspergillus pseudoustus]|uniref:Cytochrome P450 n=1 Tax=Aspergillus pseudoustus TaxID=1810923 RepID=A0ABR4JVP9_9EURO
MNIGDAFCVYACNSIATLIYGDDIGSISVSEARKLDDFVQTFIKSLGNEKVILDLFPVLDKIPRVSWFSKQRATLYFHTIHAYFDSKPKTALSRPSRNMSHTLAEKFVPGDDDDNKQLTFLAGEIYMAGVGTTPLALGALAAMATMHPAEAGILRGQLESSPDRIDYPHSPTQRKSRTYTPSSTSPCMYNGYRIPSDAFITPFQWAINRDPSVFADPHEFRPQRWIDDAAIDHRASNTLPLPAPALFGFGKRIWPGQAFAGNALAIAMAVLVWGFTFEALSGFEGGDDAYRYVYIPPCDRIRMRVRSEKHREVMEREWENTEKGVARALDEVGREVGLV